MTLKPSGGNGSALAWIKSSYSTGDGPDCVEVAWRKSSYSTGDGPECVEVATAPGTILIRDSKNPTGPRLAFTPTTWADFLPYATASGH
ncbi:MULTISPECIES: DUF397 domain-containing protein [unclassified Streptomyces]|uniref:DUF397 domain-containing protein n=1 Tax=unclassified Streptomyces TaxID=2593676 RepID=UPI00087E6F7E|nr:MULTISPECIES: DUF397 domain-containing protein [unclassified Streptomyces]PBC83297.1 uncharacterized protein DUF397 [Streptomyces sp. 2321.6]SDR43600.1 protein of unknown function [Streptomyces sp. KS_16]SEC91556.1 protein of unknown function [Streptomyces sp. 2133.1]SNC69375.1 protein of unknown function [Streptomyces sp. 2114.4]